MGCRNSCGRWKSGFIAAGGGGDSSWRSPGREEGERTERSVLFAEIVKCSCQADRLNPTDSTDRLNHNPYGPLSSAILAECAVGGGVSFRTRAVSFRNPLQSLDGRSGDIDDRGMVEAAGAGVVAADFPAADGDSFRTLLIRWELPVLRRFRCGRGWGRISLRSALIRLGVGGEKCRTGGSGCRGIRFAGR